MTIAVASGGGALAKRVKDGGVDRWENDGGDSSVILTTEITIEGMQRIPWVEICVRGGGRGGGFGGGVRTSALGAG